MTDVRLRPARTSDVRAIRELIRPYAERGILITKETVDYFEAVQEFLVAEEVLPDSGGATSEQASAAGEGPRLLGCAALHVLWEDLGEIRTVATHPEAAGRGIGRALVSAQLERARAIGVQRVFCLTFEVVFFTRLGFEVMDDQEAVDPEVFAELLRSHDEGVAEFLDLARVKPNTLGNTRMIRWL